MNRRDFFTLTAIGLTDAVETSSQNGIKEHLESLSLRFANVTDSLKEKLDQQAHNTSAKILALQNVCMSQVGRIDSLEFKQLLIFTWLFILTIFSGVDLISSAVSLLT